MYNRYIPQADGSYQRNHVADRPPHPDQRRKQSQQEVPPPVPPCPIKHTPEPVGGFLKQLLPQNFDTADLIIVLLLLLLSGDCEEDRNTALLTLALYLFM